jgi:transposase
VSRYRLSPTKEQEAVLLEHCRHARFVWNLAVQQHAHWQPGRRAAPGYNEQSRQLTDARAEFAWLRAGSQTVQQQALRDFAQAMRSFFGGVNRRPTWRKAGRNEGFRQVAVKPGHVRKLNRNVGQVWVPKVGWVKFRWSRAVRAEVKSYRVVRDRAGRRHVVFAAVPDPIPAPGSGEGVGVDRGVTVSAALSTGELLTVSGLGAGELRRLRVLQRKLARAHRGSNRRKRGTSTDLARRFDVVCVEDLKIRSMTRSAKGTLAEPGRCVRQKAGLNRSILAHGWGQLVTRLTQKAPGRVEKINPAFTSQTCNSCGHVDPASRESQARFRCTACGYRAHAEVNAALNIAGGRPVTARGGSPLGRPVNREPQLATSVT